MKLLPRAVAHSQSACRLISLALALTLAPAAWVQAAGTPAPAPAQTPTHALDTAGSYTPKPKETLDQVIQKTMAASPLKIELLRQAFIKHNPQAFMAGSKSRFKKGVSLKIPDHDLLIQETMQVHEKTTDLQPAQAGNTSGSRDERRQWVRYP
jgi:Tfp pilus assembly protein FimV